MRLYSVCLCDFGGSILLIVVLIEIVQAGLLRMGIACNFEGCYKKALDKKRDLCYNKYETILTKEGEEYAKVFVLYQSFYNGSGSIISW